MHRFISNGKDNKCTYPNSICHYKQASAHYRDNVFTLRCFQSHCNTAAMQSTCRNIAERMGHKSGLQHFIILPSTVSAVIIAI